MKKAKSATRPASKRSKAPTTVDEYVARVPEPSRRMLKKMRATIRSTVPTGATETVSYQIPAFTHNGVLV